MRLAAYRLTIVASALAGTFAGVALGVVAVPALRFVLRDWEPFDWDGVDD